MPPENVQIEEDEIDLKEVFSTLKRYKWMILAFVLLFTIAAAAFAYFKPNVYQAESTVEISTEKKGVGSQEDILSMAIGGASTDVDTEIVIVQSLSLIQKAMASVDLTHHYFTTRHFKKTELYKSSPFEVGMKRGFGIHFELFPVDKRHYKLLVEDAKDENRTEWSYEGIHTYGQEVKTPHFHLNVVKKGKMEEERYSFYVLDTLKAARNVKSDHLSVSQVSKKASVISIKYSDNVALRATEFTNALAQAYVRQNIERKTREAELKLKFINRQLESISRALQQSALKLEEFKKDANTIDLSAKAQQLMEQMSKQETELGEVEISLKMLQALSEQIKSGKHLESISVGGLNMQNSSLALMIKELQDAIIKYDAMREDYTEVYPDVVKLRKTIRALKRNIIDRIQSLTANISERKRLLENSLAKQQKELNMLPANERAYSELQRHYMVNEKIYSYLLEKQSETEIIKASTVSQNMIIDRAYMPEKPIKPKRKLIVLVGMILGLIVGIAVAFLRAYLDDRVRTEEDLAHYTSVPLFGVIPFIKKNVDKIAVFVSPKSAVAEAYRTLRTNLRFLVPKLEEGQGVIVAVTSTVGGEGKTTISTNLAGIVSLSGQRTIVLNLDMRKPTLHKKFDLPNQKGMSTLLSGHTELSEVIQHTVHENLDVITSGPIPPNPSELIQSKRTSEILLALRGMYDVIILDTPPVGLVTDARILMHEADINLYIVCSEYSKKEYFKLIERLKSENISGFGIVLNCVKDIHGGYGYGYGYYEE